MHPHNYRSTISSISHCFEEIRLQIKEFDDKFRTLTFEFKEELDTKIKSGKDKLSVVKHFVSFLCQLSLSHLQLPITIRKQVLPVKNTYIIMGEEKTRKL